MEKAVVYVDIESLMDLRQGFLVSKGVDREDIFNYIRSEDYNFRRIDNLMEFTVDEYRSYVDGGDLDTLRNSTITYTLSVLVNSIANFGLRSSIDGAKLIPVVWVNIYPFELSEEERNMMRDCVFEYLDADCYVEIINMSPEELSPLMMVENNVKQCLIYNYSRWLNAHGKLLTEIERMDCDIMCPPLYQKEPTEADKKTFEAAGFQDAFSYLEMASSIYFNLRFLPCSFYNSYIVAKDYIDVLNETIKEKMSEDSKEYEDEIEEYLNEQFAR